MNAMLNTKYRYMDNKDIQNEIYSKLDDQNNLNQMELDQRQRIFEDIIIQRIKVIQSYVKKQLKTLKNQIAEGGSKTGSIVSNPVILNSIHNDGMALDLKIKEHVKYKFEAFEQKGKLKDDKLI